MSHNILKLNTNAFDVNSNRTESITSLEYAYYQCDTSAGRYTTANYPFTPSSGQNFLIYRGVVDNNISSGFTEVNHATYTSFIEKYQFTANAKYRLSAIVGMDTTYQNGTFGAYFYNETTSTVISNSFYHQKNALNYCCRRRINTIYEHTTGATAANIVLRIFALSNPITTTTEMYHDCNILIEKLQ